MTAPPPAVPVPQPYLHELVSCVRAPTTALSGADGQLRAAGAQGAFRLDSRVLSELVLEVDGQEPAPVGHDQLGPATARFTGIVRHLGDPTADPTVRVERERRVHGDGLEEQITLVNTSRRPVSATVRLVLAADFAAMDAVKRGGAGTPVPPTPTTAGAAFTGAHTRTTVAGLPRPDHQDRSGDHWRLQWRVTIAAGAAWHATLAVQADSPAVAPEQAFRPAGGTGWQPVARDGPRDLVRLLAASAADLDALTLTDPAGDAFVAAGSPWYLTLFGRDSLWAARLALPLGTDLARGTLRALAHRQGTRHDPATAEAPGKMPHEVRALPQHIVGDRLVYYGTVDATCLWVCLLHDAWRWGMATDDVADLLDPLEAALEWLVDHGDPDGDGFLKYVDRTGHGLANQGWKDSADAIQFPDGTLAQPPIALSEAQAYAYEAAIAGAALLATFGRPGAARLRAWAGRLRERFRSAFWVRDARGSFPAVALDGANRPVDVATSNLGHLLGTGMLTPAESATVAARLREPDLDCGYGLRTLSADAAGYNPYGYHTGAVWPHDTAIAVQGLARAGHTAGAMRLAAGLLRAAPSFDHRLPELYAGTSDAPRPYPAACRPQGWSAAAVVALLHAALGMVADVPDATLTVNPCAEFAAWFPLQVDGLQLAGAPLAVAVDVAGRARVDTTAPVSVLTRPPAPRPRAPRARILPVEETQP